MINLSEVIERVAVDALVLEGIATFSVEGFDYYVILNSLMANGTHQWVHMFIMFFEDISLGLDIRILFNALALECREQMISLTHIC